MAANAQPQSQAEECGAIYHAWKKQDPLQTTGKKFALCKLPRVKYDNIVKVTWSQWRGDVTSASSPSTSNS